MYGEEGKVKEVCCDEGVKEGEGVMKGVVDGFFG